LERAAMKKTLFVITLCIASTALILPEAVSASFAWTSAPSAEQKEDPSRDELLLSQEEAQKSKEEDLGFLEEDQNRGQAQIVPDPLYHFNKGMYYVNDKLYFWVLKPVARVWKAIIPEFARTSLKNFFYNLRFPVRFISCALQGNGKKVEAETTRFLLNSTIGLAGFLNPAKKYPELNPSKEDLGQTFGAWGIDNGFYLVVPLIGPTTFRDGIGYIADFFLDPIFWIGLEIDNLWVTGGIYAGETINDTSFRIGDYEAIKKAALDPYAAIRNGYIQNRNTLIEE
jgi:phospholipid-binding lipoprotein MlaA